ncbi:CASP-like protein 1 isoform X1 [Bidens hawaiensis]|uniref:CASP-like protein 1 isoform X1 n=1 Tax=Bidens hawaiensis TaxID=980011 RepID=UPI00404A5CE8
MASTETGAPPRATTQTSVRWSSKLTRYVSNSGMVAIENQRKVDVILRALMFVFSLVGVVVMVSSKQSERIPVSPVMMIRVDAKFTHSASFTYYVSAFSVLGLYSMITGYLSYSALKKQERISTGQLLQLLLLDTFLLGITASATGAGGGVAYEALKGNPHIHWMKICNIFDKFCDHLAASGVMAVLASSMLILLIWTSAGAMARNAGR